MSENLESAAQDWLVALLQAEGARAGSVHHERDGDLVLTAAHNIPGPVLDRVRFVPRGKGMAGLAQVRRASVQTCNLVTDDTGRINPMAKLVGGGSAVAIPVLRGEGEVYAVVGLSFDAEGEIPVERLVLLETAVATVP